jgi:hypothetical protein
LDARHCIDALAPIALLSDGIGQSLLDDDQKATSTELHTTAFMSNNTLHAGRTTNPQRIDRRMREGSDWHAIATQGSEDSRLE